MGLYDNISIEYPLPIESYVPIEYKPYIHQAINEDGFQTKDLACIMCNFHIDNMGRIFLLKIPDFESNEKQTEERVYCHGHVNVYTVVYLEELKKEFWLEYDLKFTDSLLVSASMIHPTEEKINELHRSVQKTL
jgi:hypothetical protein